MNKNFYNTILDKQLSNNEIPQGEEYDAWRLRILKQEEFDSLSDGQASLSYEQLAYISFWAVLAPSSHNTVPIRVKLNPEKNLISIFVDRKFILPHSDVTGRQAIISVGCALANIEVAASHFGYGIVEEYHGGLSSAIKHTDVEEERYYHIMNLYLKKGGYEIITQSLESMKNRKVVRSEYNDSVKIEASVIELIKDHIKNRFSSVEMACITDRQELHKIAKFQEDADRTVFENDNFILELGKWLHPNKKENVKVGMRGKEFGFDDSFSDKMHKGLLHEDRLTADQIAGFARGGRVAIDSSSALLIFNIEHDTLKELLLVGRAYQEVALILHSNGLFHSIHAGIVEVNWINKIVATTVLHTKKRPSIIMRVGVPKRNEDKLRPHSGRPDLAYILL